MNVTDDPARCLNNTTYKVKRNALLTIAHLPGVLKGDRVHYELMELTPPRELGSSSSDVFDRPKSTGSEPFSLLKYLDATKFVLLSFFALIETICSKISSKSRLKSVASPLKLDVRRSKNVAA